MTKRERQLLKVLKYKQLLVNMDTQALIFLLSSPGTIEVAAIAARELLEERGLSAETFSNKKDQND